MNGLKYITFHGSMHIEIVMFMNSIDHSYMVKMLNVERENIIGAGFISCNEDNPEPRCYGKSTSLKIVADERDTSILLRAMRWKD